MLRGLARLLTLNKLHSQVHTHLNARGHELRLHEFSQYRRWVHIGETLTEASCFARQWFGVSRIVEALQLAHSALLMGNATGLTARPAPVVSEEDRARCPSVAKFAPGGDYTGMTSVRDVQQAMVNSISDMDPRPVRAHPVGNTTPQWDGPASLDASPEEEHSDSMLFEDADELFEDALPGGNGQWQWAVTGQWAEHMVRARGPTMLQVDAGVEYDIVQQRWGHVRQQAQGVVQAQEAQAQLQDVIDRAKALETGSSGQTPVTCVARSIECLRRNSIRIDARLGRCCGAP